MHVLVVGAGLGGLCLAHGLRSAGHDVTVLERGPRSGAQPASYGIHLNADGLRALHACLPEAAWRRLDAAMVPAEDVVRFHDPNHGVLATLDLRTPEHATDPVTRRRAVTRGHLRDALLLGLDETGVVAWDSRVTSYDVLPDERVRAHLGDGTTLDGDLLVGADGSGSRVRQQRLPHLRRLDLGILNVAGRLPLTPDLEQTLPAVFTDTAVNNVVPPGPGWLFLSTWATGDTGSASLAGAESSGRYVVWAWAAPRASYPSDGDLTGAQLQEHVLARTASWSPALRTVLASTEPDAVGPVPLRSMPRLPDWEPSRVTLLGDAIHNMTPMGGVGANTALRDADELRRALLAHPTSPVEAVRTYEQRMRVYANAALHRSTANAQRAANPARLPRAVFRTLLRAAEASPAVKRRVFHVPTLGGTTSA